MKNKLMKLAMIVGVLALLASVGLVPTVAKATEYELSLTLENKTGDPDWYVVEDNTSGILHYNPKGATFDFSFQATGLQPETDYDLIYFANTLVGDYGLFLANFTTDIDGNIAVVEKTINLGGNLPSGFDNLNTEDYCLEVCNSHPCNPIATICHGAKIWLVLPNVYDKVTNEMVWANWQPASYLFDTDLITYQHEPAIGIPSTGTVLPASIGVSIVQSSLNFGAVQQGATSSVLDITITNTGSVNIKVSVLVTDIVGTLFKDCLEISSDDGVTWVDSETWFFTPILTGATKTIKARLHVPAGYSLGTFSGTVFILAQEAL